MDDVDQLGGGHFGQVAQVAQHSGQLGDDLGLLRGCGLGDLGQLSFSSLAQLGFHCVVLLCIHQL
ncbi:hypothetical protein EBU95_19110 [bacterium]|nr:hypothetical protein [bacterium]